MPTAVPKIAYLLALLKFFSPIAFPLIFKYKKFKIITHKRVNCTRKPLVKCVYNLNAVYHGQMRSQIYRIF